MPRVERSDESWDKVKGDIMLLERTDFGDMGIDEPEEELQDVFGHPESIKFVARHSKKIVGYAISAPLEFFSYLPSIGDDENFGRGNTQYISSIAVLPEHQGKGLGKEMLKGLASEAKKRGYSRVTGHFLESSARMFGKLGGVLVRSYPNWHGKNTGAEYMCLDL